MRETLESLCARLQGLHRALLCTHVAPDPDAIGSCFGLQQCLSKIGIQAEVYLADPMPRTMRELTSGLPYHREFSDTLGSDAFDAVIVTDTATVQRMGPEYQRLADAAPQLIVIDHHTSNSGWGTSNYIDGGASSSAAIVLEIATELAIAIDRPLAELLFAGLMDDTGSFRFNNADPKAFAAAHTLVKAGARPDEVAKCLYFSVPKSQLELQAAALQTLSFSRDGSIATIYVDEQMLAACQSQTEETEGLVDLARSIEGVKVAAFVRQIVGGWKASLRSQDVTIDVNTVASKFGGGGHKMAAGCRLEGTVEQALADLISEINKVIDTSRSQSQ